MNWSDFWDAATSLVPPVLVGVLFWVMIRSILRADRTERKVYSEIEAEMRAAQTASSNSATGVGSNTESK